VGDVCKSLLFLLVSLVTVSLHCWNYIARRNQIHTSCITKDKGYDWEWPEETNGLISF